MSLTYKFVELSIVSDDMIEKCVNQWVHAGWTFDDIRFVSTNASRRPVMAFVSFVRDDLASPVDRVATATEAPTRGREELPTPLNPAAKRARVRVPRVLAPEAASEPPRRRPAYVDRDTTPLCGASVKIEGAVLNWPGSRALHRPPAPGPPRGSVAASHPPAGSGPAR